MRRMNLNFAVFVPVYNEREKLGAVLERILHAAGHRISALVVADDGSTDGSDSLAARFTEHVVHLEKNSGNGAATRAALRYIDRRCHGIDAVIRIDGDGQHEPSLLPEVMERIERGADVVVCSRFHPKSDTSCAMLDRVCLNTAIAQMVRLVTRWPVSDARSGFMGFRWNALAPIIETFKTEHYGIPIELLLRVWRHVPSAHYAEIPHPAMYQRGISERLDQKYLCETIGDKVGRLDEAFHVFLSTCTDLRIS